MSTEEKQLSRNYRGWRSNRRYFSIRNRNSEQDKTTSISSRSRWRSRHNAHTFSEKEKLARRTKSILSKLTPGQLPRLLPKMIDIYSDVKDENTLKTFLTVIFDCVTATNLLHAQHIEILNELLSIDKSTISAADFKQCVLTLSEQNFKKSMIITEHVYWKSQQKKSLLSMSKFIGKLIASKIMDFGTSINYLKVLFVDEKNENNIEAVCCIFTEIYEFISYDKRIALRNAQMDAIDVSMKSHLLVYGYAHRYYNNYIPRCVVDFCIGYYDTECYLFKYYQTLQRIGKDNRNYGMRIRMLIKNVIQMRMNSN